MKLEAFVSSCQLALPWPRSASVPFQFSHSMCQISAGVLYEENPNFCECVASHTNGAKGGRPPLVQTYVDEKVVRRCVDCEAEVLETDRRENAGWMPDIHGNQHEVVAVTGFCTGCSATNRWYEDSSEKRP